MSRWYLPTRRRKECMFAPGEVEDVSISKYILRRDYTIVGHCEHEAGLATCSNTTRVIHPNKHGHSLAHCRTSGVRSALRPLQVATEGDALVLEEILRGLPVGPIHNRRNDGCLGTLPDVPADTAARDGLRLLLRATRVQLRAKVIDVVARDPRCNYLLRRARLDRGRVARRDNDLQSRSLGRGECGLHRRDVFILALRALDVEANANEAGVLDVVNVLRNTRQGLHGHVPIHIRPAKRKVLAPMERVNHRS
eukprot:scaffold87284_cov67-Phaeocystis_antarctica.AAC.2